MKQHEVLDALDFVWAERQGHCPSALYEDGYSDAVADAKKAIKRLPDTNANLAKPFRAVDDQDWVFLIDLIPDGGRGRFWKAVFSELRPLLNSV
jgi:hypothetical protein